MSSYRLDQERWLEVELLDGSTTFHSLTEVFLQACKIRRIVGNPLEVAVIMRLLLAIGYDAAPFASRSDWQTAWITPESLPSRCAQYVAQWADRFDLYDPQFPFAQHPALPLPAGTPAILVYDRAQGNNPVFLDASVVADPQPIRSDQAARGILVTHAFAGSGTGGLNPLNGGKKDTMYAGPLAVRAVAFLEGESLAATLLLNSVIGAKPGMPAWRRPAPNGIGELAADGVCDRLTRLTRFARLTPSPDGRDCVGASLFMGCALPAEDDGADPMIPRYVASDGKLKDLRISRERDVWRQAEILLAGQVGTGHRPIKALEQLRRLATDDRIAYGTQVAIRLVGASGNAQGPKTDLWRDDTLAFDLSVLATDDRYERMRTAVGTAEQAADRLRARIAAFCREYLNFGEAKAKPEEVAALVQELAGGLDGYWSKIAPMGRRIATDEFDATAWKQTIDAAVQSSFEAAVNRLPPSARRYRAEFVRPRASQPATKSPAR